MMNSAPPYTLHQLEVFAAVVEHGGFSRAAAALALTQPTVSMQVKQLAEALGAPLFEAQPRGRGRSAPRLTAAGEEVLAAALGARRLTLGLRERLEALAGLRRGRLRVCAASTAEYFVPRILGGFQRAYPGVAVELQVLNRRAVSERLGRDEDDLYIMTRPPSELPLVTEPFVENALVVVAPAKHRLVGRGAVRLAEIVEEEWVSREEGAGTRLVADSALAARGVRLTTRLQLGSNEAVKQAVIGGFGLAILSLHALRDELLHYRRIRLLTVEGFPIASRWYWVRRADRRPSRVAEAARAFAREPAAELDAELQRLLARGLRGADARAQVDAPKRS